VAITTTVLDLARSMPPPVLRSLDAIHLATARLVGDDLDHLITYDKRMIAAAVAVGMPVATPA
jgi:predicted nucleic acid-binding protein